ncbi:MAG: DNA topoisomerase I [Candidatus Bathyarchaeia archaeon]|jgi:DNA topoisomerase-1|nr:DNA topoisomerase I [Candidatus Bathyarchaeota archaeon A05DMB-4]MDH7595802.1 DNA topoisomerase I [Candidatus Bathyarchaeota archaeon]
MENYTLIVTEKPDAAKRIAQALDADGKPQNAKRNGVPYFVAQRNRTILVVPAIGHLYTVMQEDGKRGGYPVFNFKWAPRYAAEKTAQRTRLWIDTISSFAENAADFIDACDYDVEGSLIGYTILKYACNGKERVAKRMKYSTLTKPDLEKAYEQPLAHLDFALIEAGRTRHEVDWLYGINLSRALTQAAKRQSGTYATLSTGRVQGPTLRFLVTREHEINCHVPTPYWTVHAELEIDGKIFEAAYEKSVIGSKAEAAAIVEACKGKSGIVDRVDVKESHVAPPFPFDLGALQYEAYGVFGYTPSRTSSIAQRLYLDALISYPRTSSQKLPKTIGYRQILNGLKREKTYGNLAQDLLAKETLKPNERKQEDPAHPAIYPTGNLPDRQLDVSERRIWDLIVRRFMAVFGEPALKQDMRVSVAVDGHHFFLHGRQILRDGWMRFYKPYVRSKEIALPPVKEGDKIDVRKIICNDKFTIPPPRYTPSSLLRKMETEGIGTKATRAEIIETLYNRKYITDKTIAVTDLGFDVTETLHDFCPGVISVELTKQLEQKMEQIQNGEETRENVLREAVAYLAPLLEEFKRNEEAIGKALSEAVRKARIQERILGNCPACGTGKLMILYSRKTGKRFIGCTNYFKNQCKTSLPLPQKGLVKATGRTCRVCGWPTVTVRFAGRRPWQFCVNPACPQKRKGSGG